MQSAEEAGLGLGCFGESAYLRKWARMARRIDDGYRGDGGEEEVRGWLVKLAVTRKK